MRLLQLLGIRSNPGGRILCCAVVFSALAVSATPQATPWDRPASQIAHEIAEALGRGSAHLTIENLSTIPKESVPVIRRMMEDKLKADGVNLRNGESEHTIRLTLSENARGGLWVAEVQTANETRVVMVPADVAPLPGPVTRQKVLLHRDTLAKTSEMQWTDSAQPEGLSREILAAAEIQGDLVLLTADQTAVFAPSSTGWVEKAHAEFPAGHAASRDPRGVFVPAADGSGFRAFAPGVQCAGALPAASSAAEPATWNLHCQQGDDPWPLFQIGPDAWMKAFYNSGRDFFTGVVTPAMGADLPPFYSAGILPGRPGGPAPIVAGIDGKVQIVEGNQLQTVAETRAWGSDLAVLSSGCGAAAQVVASSAGDGSSDNVRAYEIQGLAAVAASEPMQLSGTAMSLWAAPDGKSAIVIVRVPQGQRFDYEVDRVTQTCN